MREDIRSLWQALEAFSFGDAGAALTFDRRLARENGWTPAYARRVIHEYKRFVLLAASGPEVATPSDQVDQAWHLHLTYSRSYWTELCGRVLGRSLHHGPTRGGAAQRQHFAIAYQRTLDRYRATFEQEPPRDIWPPLEERFGSVDAFRRIHTAEHWVIAKPAFLRVLRASTPRALAARAALALPIPLAGCAAVGLISPFDLRGPAFLGFFVFVWGVCLLAAFRLRGALTGATSPVARADERALDPYQAACLAGGARHMLHAALASLVASGALLYERTSTRFARGGALPARAHPFERAVHALVQDGPNVSTAALNVQAERLGADVTRELERRGLLVPAGTNWPLWVALIAPAVGVIKIVVGIARDHPVGILCALTLAAGLAARVWFHPRPWRTMAGQKLLDALRSENAPLRERAASFQLVDDHLVLAFGLFGSEVLIEPSLADLPSAFALGSAPPGDGADSGAGDGGGCGGCGCGGCGE